ncbi:hypothetical protein LEP1GSC150_4170 [Leptospira interrogans serovar Copenhageni str. LT2050]|uniref:Uncharacterized protein n=1 Tax=Leptospira interrogans serovar Copenhageni str. LT2050 TaxID=1001598 RepID=M3H5C6_LEPIT|nr:hypothetical protein LEP1GSC150_4170 [Leptospira interrogans serovar Copenhageni str. LT2050]
MGVIFSGRIWAASAWGVPWDKTDARLQSFTVLFISLIAYFVFRILITDVFQKKDFFGFFKYFMCDQRGHYLGCDSLDRQSWKSSRIDYG